MERFRILFVSPYLPSRIRVRPYNLIRALAERGHQVTLLALAPPGDDASGLADLRAWCQGVQVVSLARWRVLWNGLRALPGRTPFQAAYSRSPQMMALIQRTLAEVALDVVHVEHLRGAELSRAVSQVPVVYDSVDSIALLFEQAQRSGPTWRSRLMAAVDLERTRRYEGLLLARHARTLVTSTQDRKALAGLATEPGLDGRLVVLPNGVDLRYFQPLAVQRDPATIVMTGKMSYHANLAAALDLANRIMPLVWARQPDAQLFLVGKDPPKALLTLADHPRITVTGTVPDLRPYLARATVAVSPLRYGVGIQNKLLEAMAMATPVVSVSQATAALQTEPGRDLLVADTPESFAEAVSCLLANDALCREVGQAGRHYVETHHNWDRIAERLETVYGEAILDATNAR